MYIKTPNLLFFSARLKLTAWYVGIILFITGAISCVFYLRASLIIHQQFNQIEQRWQKEQRRSSTPPEEVQIGLLILADNLHSAKRDLAMQLLFINAGIAVFVSISGYILSGKTLAPIQKVYEEQKRFITDAAHELRTPITALKTSLEVNLMDKKLPKLSQIILKENLEDVVQLEKLATRLLRLSHPEKIVSNLQTQPLDEITQSALRVVEPLAKKKKITLEYTPPHKELMIPGEKDSLIELLLIILDNAIKYSPSKTTISVVATSRSSYAHIAITDQGVGIPPDDVPHIFDRFYRVDVSRTEAFSNADFHSHGLGLSIAQKIVYEHRGKISVKSTLSEGTTFVISLPLR